MHTNELPAFVYAKPILLPRISRRRDQSPSFSAKWFIATEWDLSVSCVMSLKIETTTMRQLYAMRGASESTISVLPSSFRSVFSILVQAPAYVCVCVCWNDTLERIENGRRVRDEARNGHAQISRVQYRFESEYEFSSR